MDNQHLNAPSRAPITETSRTGASWSLYTSTDIPALIDRINRLQARVTELESAAAESRPIDDDPIPYALTERELGTPARRAADAIQAMHDPTVIGYIVGVDRLSLTLQPRTAADWTLWCDLLGVDTARVTHRGSLATGSGQWEGVPVTVTAQGVGALLAAQLQDGERR